MKDELNQVMAHLQSLVCKAVTGLEGSAFEDHHGMTTRDYLLGQDGGKYLGVLTSIEEQAEALLEDGMDPVALKEALTQDVLKIQESLGNWGRFRLLQTACSDGAH